MGRGELGGSGCFKAEPPLRPGAGTAQLLKLEQQEWGRKKVEKWVELPKGSAAPSCKLSALSLPWALLLSGGSPKRVLSSPRAGRCLWVSQRHPIAPAASSPPASPWAAALVEGAALKTSTPVPPSPGGREGGGGSQARGPGGMGDPARLALLLWRRPRQSGTLRRGMGRRTKPGGHGDTRWLCTSPRHGCWGSGSFLGWGLAGSTSLWTAVGQGVLAVPR